MAGLCCLELLLSAFSSFTGTLLLPLHPKYCIFLAILPASVAIFPFILRPWYCSITASTDLRLLLFISEDGSEFLVWTKGNGWGLTFLGLLFSSSLSLFISIIGSLLLPKAQTFACLLHRLQTLLPDIFKLHSRMPELGELCEHNILIKCEFLVIGDSASVQPHPALPFTCQSRFNSSYFFTHLINTLLFNRFIIVYIFLGSQ